MKAHKAYPNLAKGYMSEVITQGQIMQKVVSFSKAIVLCTLLCAVPVHAFWSTVFSSIKSVANVFKINVPFTNQQVGVGTAATVAIPAYVVYSSLPKNSRLRSGVALTTAAVATGTVLYNAYDTHTRLQADVEAIRKDMATQENVDAQFANVNGKLDAHTAAQTKLQDDVTALRAEQAAGFTDVTTRIDTCQNTLQQQMDANKKAFEDNIFIAQTNLITQIEAARKEQAQNAAAHQEQIARVYTTQTQHGQDLQRVERSVGALHTVVQTKAADVTAHIQKEHAATRTHSDNQHALTRAWTTALAYTQMQQAAQQHSQTQQMISALAQALAKLSA